LFLGTPGFGNIYRHPYSALYLSLGIAQRGVVSIERSLSKRAYAADGLPAKDARKQVFHSCYVTVRLRDRERAEHFKRGLANVLAGYDADLGQRLSCIERHHPLEIRGDNDDWRAIENGAQVFFPLAKFALDALAFGNFTLQLLVTLC